MRARTCAVLLAVLAAVLTMSTPAQAMTGTFYTTSTVWSGVVRPGSGITRVSGDVTLPKVDPRCGVTSVASMWVGLGGYGQLPFVQNGVTISGTGATSAWYELFDRNGKGPVVNIPIVLGSLDRVRLRAEFTKSHTVLTFTWANLSTGRTVTRVITDAGRYYQGASAEWITEAPALTAAPQLARFETPASWSMASEQSPVGVRPAYTTSSAVLTLTNRSATPHAVAHVVKTASTTFADRWDACS